MPILTQQLWCKFWDCSSNKLPGDVNTGSLELWFEYQRFTYISMDIFKWIFLPATLCYSCILRKNMNQEKIKRELVKHWRSKNKRRQLEESDLFLSLEQLIKLNKIKKWSKLKGKWGQWRMEKWEVP